MKLIDKVILGHPEQISSYEIIWPPIPLALTWLGGGYWHQLGTTLKTDFCLGGIVRNKLVGLRLCGLKQGQLTTTIAVIVENFLLFWAGWVKNAVSGSMANAMRERDLSDLPPGLSNLVQSKRRRLQKNANAAFGPMPRCVKCAFSMKTPWKNSMRWMMAQTIVLAAQRIGQPANSLVEYAVTLMRERGDGEQRIREFQSAVNRCQKGKSNIVPCHKRKAGNSGMFCPLNGNVKVCAAERGLVPPTKHGVAPHDLWTAKKKL